MDTADIHRQIEERLQARRLTVPVLPSVAAMVLAVINDPGADINSLTGAIRRDPSLAGHVVKYANAPLLRAGSPVLTVGQAISRLGIRTVADVVFAACIGPRLFDAPLYAARIRRIWAESLATALWAHEINLARGRLIEGNFLCGLLHQVGLSVVLQAVQDILGPAPRPSPSNEDIERLLRTFGTRAGLDVATRWRLPPPVVEVIEYLEDPAAAPGHATLVTRVAAARLLGTLTLDGIPLDPPGLCATAQMSAAGLDQAVITRLVGREPDVRDILERG
jgi:HD-like signal output (HDOD) protein